MGGTQIKMVYGQCLRRCIIAWSGSGTLIVSGWGSVVTMKVTRKEVEAVTTGLWEEARALGLRGNRGKRFGEIVDLAIGGELPGIDRWTSWGVSPQVCNNDFAANRPLLAPQLRQSRLNFRTCSRAG